jgi:hypothetical protein
MKQKVLSIQGSGTLVLGGLRILEYIEERTGRKIAELFDAIEGSSSGALASFMLTVPNEYGEPKYSAKEVSEFITYWHNLIIDYEKTGFKTNELGYQTLSQVYNKIFEGKNLETAVRPVYGYSIKYKIMGEELKLYSWSSVGEAAGRKYTDAALSVTALPTRYIHKVGDEYHIDGAMASYNSFVDIAKHFGVRMNELSIFKLTAPDVHQVSISGIEKSFLQAPSSISFNQLKPPFLVHTYKATHAFVDDQILKHFSETSVVVSYNPPKGVIWLKLSIKEIRELYDVKKSQESGVIAKVENYFAESLVDEYKEVELKEYNTISREIELIIVKNINQQQSISIKPFLYAITVTELIEASSLISYLTKRILDPFVEIDDLLKNNELLREVKDSNIAWIGTHFVFGIIAAMSFPYTQEMKLSGKLIFPVTSSINYGLRLHVNEIHKNLVTKRVEQLLREDDFFDFFTSCMPEIFISATGVTITTSISSLMIPGVGIGYVALSGLSSGAITGFQCLVSNKKLIDNHNSSTFSSKALPYIADSMVFISLYKQATFDFSSIIDSMTSIKKVTGILGAIVAIDQISQLVADILPESILEMIDNMFEFQIFYGDINEL